MKRNKLKGRATKARRSPYAKYGKVPCKHCQQITADSRRRAQSGADIQPQATL